MLYENCVLNVTGAVLSGSKLMESILQASRIVKDSFLYAKWYIIARSLLNDTFFFRGGGGKKILGIVIFFFKISDTSISRSPTFSGFAVCTFFWTINFSQSYITNNIRYIIDIY